MKETQAARGDDKKMKQESNPDLWDIEPEIKGVPASRVLAHNAGGTFSPFGKCSVCGANLKIANVNHRGVLYCPKCPKSVSTSLTHGDE